MNGIKVISQLIRPRNINKPARMLVTKLVNKKLSIASAPLVLAKKKTKSHIRIRLKIEGSPFILVLMPSSICAVLLTESSKLKLYPILYNLSLCLTKCKNIPIIIMIIAALIINVFKDITNLLFIKGILSALSLTKSCVASKL